jgi:hypothetical protein
MRSEKLPVVNQREATSEVSGRLDKQIIYTQKKKRKKKEEKKIIIYNPCIYLACFPHLFFLFFRGFGLLRLAEFSLGHFFITYDKGFLSQSLFLGGLVSFSGFGSI